MSSFVPSFFLSFLRNATSLAQIRQIHAQLLVQGLSLHNHHLGRLVDLGFVDYARSVFDQAPLVNDYSLNSMIRAYAINGPHQHSLLFYSHMLEIGVKPSNFTYPFVFKACSVLSFLEFGEQAHSHVKKFGFDNNIFVNNSLIDFYSKCSCIKSSRQLFDEMPIRDQVSWNSIISGYVNCRDIISARNLFDEMPIKRNVICWTSLINGYGREGMLKEMLSLFRGMLLSEDNVKPNSATMVCLLSACSSLSNNDVGRRISAFIDVNKLPLDVISTTALIDMHAKCGNINKARKLFDGISNKNLVSWNAMITGCVQSRNPEEAIKLFYQMRENFVNPNEITMVNILSACATLGALELGRDIHVYLGRNLLDLNVIIATALVDMYSKCGPIDDACLVFVKMNNKDLALWNSMIMGLASHGYGKDSLILFRKMEREGQRPNDITFLGVLSACSHSGLVDDGRETFKYMCEKCGFNPKIEHYACMVDLLGRAGHLDEAIYLVGNMSVIPDPIIWGSLLSSCRIHNNMELANRIGQIVLCSEDPACHILLSNIYAFKERWDDVGEIRRLIKKKGIRKPHGCSWIEIDGIVCRFLVEDSSHSRSPEIFEMHRTLVNGIREKDFV